MPGGVMSNDTRAAPDRSDPRADAVLAERRQLIDLAYRMLGSLSEAEDPVQEAFARWFAMPPEARAAVISPGAWLHTVVSRICLNVLTSARTRRVSYVGEWLPEPRPEAAAWVDGRRDGPGDPAERVTLDESTSMAFLVVLESLTPAERVAFILHDVYRYPFSEVAAIIGRTPAACRQLASSARHRLEAVQHPGPVEGARARVVADFKRAWEDHDIDGLIALLDPDATAIADGGGIVSAVLEPLNGAQTIARACVDIVKRAPRLTIIERKVNGQPGLVTVQDGTTVAVVAFGFVDQRIRRIWAVLNPAKLGAWTTTR
jgi:RNA polymerase sigma-70 factor (ECF subfamily)